MKSSSTKRSTPRAGRSTKSSSPRTPATRLDSRRDSDSSTPRGRPVERKFEREEAGGVTKLHSVSDRLTTLDDVLRFAKVDLSVWEVERHVVNSWEAAAKDEATGKLVRTTLFQVKAWLRRRVAKDITDAAESLFRRIKSHKPAAPKPPKRRPAGANTHLLELSLTDVHLGKLAWGRETGANYDTAIAERVFLNAVDDLLSRTVPFPVERIVLPVGSDFFHVDNWRNTTTRGTPVEHDGRFARVYEAGCMAMVNAVDRCLAVAPVELLWVPGNHDRETSFYLGHFLQAWYRGVPHVAVDLSPSPRKYVSYGPTLLGLTHGDKEKYDRLPQIMAVERPKEWSAAKHREWHIGHGHRHRSRRTWDNDEFEGVRVRMLSALCATDGWHHGEGYIGSRRCAEAYLWHRKEGYAGHLSVNARE